MPTSGFVESMPVFCNWSWGHPREMFLLVNGVMILRLLYDLLYIDRYLYIYIHTKYVVYEFIMYYVIFMIR